MNSSTNNPREREREEDEVTFTDMAVVAIGAIAGAALVAWGISSLFSTIASSSNNNSDKNKIMMKAPGKDGELIDRDEFEDNPLYYFSKLRGAGAGAGAGAGTSASGGGGDTTDSSSSGDDDDDGLIDRDEFVDEPRGYFRRLCGTTDNSSNNNNNKDKKMMKAPGRNGELIPRDEFEENPRRHFRQNRGIMQNSVADTVVLEGFGVDCHPQKATRILTVKWRPPSKGWIKCNTDGSSSSSSSSSSKAGCGGLYRDCNGDVCGVFVQNLGAGSANYAEFFAVVIAVEIAFAKGWRKIWFEMDSASTLANFFNMDYAPSWTQLRRRWEKCLVLLESMEVRSSHIYREANVPADILSNLSYKYEGFEWWDSVIPAIRKVVAEERVGKDYYRFC